jgi:seryl-tRNA(Sec) selenium transferase
VYSLLEELLVRKLDGTAQGRAERVLSLPRAEIAALGERILGLLPRGSARLVESEITSGGGSAPDESRPSLSLELTAPGGAEDLLARLRHLDVPVIGTIVDGAVRLSLATLHGEDEQSIARSIRAALEA